MKEEPNCTSSRSNSNENEPILLPSGCVAVTWKVKHRSAVRKGETIATAFPPKDQSAKALLGMSSVANNTGSGAVHRRPSSKSKVLGSLLSSRLQGGAAVKTSIETKANSQPEGQSAQSGIRILAPSDGLVNIIISDTSSGSIKNSRVLGNIEPCRHPTFIDGMCAVCGKIQSEISRQKSEGSIRKEIIFDATKNPDRMGSNKSDLYSTGIEDEQHPDQENSLSRVTVSGGVTVNLSSEEAANITNQNRRRLFTNKKLSLVLDLDHTLVHATNDTRAAFEFDREDLRLILLPFINGATGQSNQNNNMRHYVKMRPYLKEFLLGILDKYEASIYTAGTRAYAMQVVRAMCRFVVGAMDEEELCHYKRCLAQAKWKLSTVEQNVKESKGSSNIIGLTSDPDKSAGKIIIETKQNEKTDIFVKLKPENGFEDTSEGQQEKRKVKFSDNAQVFVIPEDSKLDFKEEIANLQEKVNHAEALELKACELEQKLFGSRIVSRCDVGDLGRDVKSVRRVFPCGGMMAAIIDDREDVWANASDNITTHRVQGEPPLNLILVKPYHFNKFRGFSEVNNKAGEDFSELGKTLSELDVEDDDGLFWCNDILGRLHQRFYLHVSKDLRTPGKMDSEITVPQILEQMRKEVLRGCTVALSGLIPLVEQSKSENKPQARPPVTRYVEDLGGTVVSDVKEITTHVIAARMGTQKVFKGARVRGCAVVNMEWLMRCYWSISPRDVTPYLLLPIRVKESAIEQVAKQTSSKDIERQSERQLNAHEVIATSENMILATSNDDEQSSDEDDFTDELEKSLLSDHVELRGKRTSILLLTDDDEDSDDGLSLPPPQLSRKTENSWESALKNKRALRRDSSTDTGQANSKAHTNMDIHPPSGRKRKVGSDEGREKRGSSH